MAGDRPSQGGPQRGGSRLPIGLMVIGSQMAGFTIIGVLLDRYVFGSMPAFTIGLTLFGFVAAFVQLIRFTKAKYGPKPPGTPDEGPR